MPAKVTLSLKELDELIEETEAQGGDATEFKKLRAEFAETQPRKPATRTVMQLGPREEGTTEERIEALRQQSYIEHGEELECMVCHNKVATLVSGTCENCFREWALTIKKR